MTDEDMAQAVRDSTRMRPEAVPLMESPPAAAAALTKAVLNEQVLAFLKKNCPHCWGSGWVRNWVFLDEDTQIRKLNVCKCARSRFMKANSAKVKQTEDGLEWVA